MGPTDSTFSTDMLNFGSLPSDRWLLVQGGGAGFRSAGRRILHAALPFRLSEGNPMPVI